MKKEELHNFVRKFAEMTEAMESGMEKLKDNRDVCVFMYDNGQNQIETMEGLTLEVAKQMFNDNYDDMINQTRKGFKINTAIIRGDGEFYLIIREPDVIDGYLSEQIFHDKF